MSAATLGEAREALAAIEEARVAGATLRVSECGKLRVEADAPISERVLDRLRAHKLEVVRLIQSGWFAERMENTSSQRDAPPACQAAPPPVADCWRDYFEERAAIREHDGGLSRADAEAGALADCVAWWRGLNPLPASGDGACAYCGKLRPDTPVLAQGGHAWLHRACWAPMNAERDEVAREAVSAACHLRP